MWVKRGLLFGPYGRIPWASHSALTPTPVVLADRVRVFAGFRDAEGISRIGFVDLDLERPTRIIAVCERPALDVGDPGMFDDNGVILGDVVPDGESWRLYYVGFQKVARAKFLAFTGLAMAGPSCDRFERVSRTPVLDRADEGVFIRAIHTVRQEQGGWRIWYAAGRAWQPIGGTDFPCYEILTAFSNDGHAFPTTGTACLAPRGTEYRIGRPRVTRTATGYEMLFTKGTLSGDYTPGWAASPDGLTWIRRDERVGLPLSETGWDSRHLCYPVPFIANGRRYLVYNGNDMGRDGFGLAEWMA